jgi:7-cyano-7-deazaguanine reductase
MSLTDDERKEAAQSAAYATGTEAIDKACEELYTFENAYPGRDYEIKIDCPEFTAVCPMTDQPDFGQIVISYVPDRHCIELKALKLYLQAYRNVGIFHEAVTNRILDDLVQVTKPRRMVVSGEYRPRGGITTTVVVTYPDPGGRNAD